jgi:hypothetical protein
MMEKIRIFGDSIGKRVIYSEDENRYHGSAVALIQ